MSIKNTTISLVLGLLFLSLMVIYLVTRQNPLVTGLSIVIMALALLTGVNGSWRDIGVLAGFAALVSLVAASLVGEARFGEAGRIFVPMVWGLVLVLIFMWVQRNTVPVPEDRAILVSRYPGYLYQLTAPLSAPMMPLLDHIVAKIPLYELTDTIRIEKVNTRAGHNIDQIMVTVRYQVNKRTPDLVLRGIANRGQVQQRIAKELGQDLSTARANEVFWEKLLNHQMSMEVEDIVRDVIFQNSQNAASAYAQREAAAEEMRERLSKKASQWGVQINALELERMDVESIRFQDPAKETAKRRLEAEREATRVELLLKAEAAAEQQRVRGMVQALRESGVDLSAETLEEIVRSAIRTSSEWGVDLDLDLTTPPSGAKPIREKKS